MNFEVGDIAINLGAVSFWNNPYHWKTTVNVMQKKTVIQATEKYFSFLDTDVLDLNKTTCGFCHRTFSCT